MQVKLEKFIISNGLKEGEVPKNIGAHRPHLRMEMFCLSAVKSEDIVTNIIEIHPLQTLVRLCPWNVYIFHVHHLSMAEHLLIGSQSQIYDAIPSR